MDSVCYLVGGRAYYWNPQAFAAVSIGRSSVRSQLLSICYFWSILAFIWRKVTGKHSVPAENLLVIRVTVLSKQLLPTLLCLLKASIWCESIMKNDRSMTHLDTLLYNDRNTQLANWLSCNQELTQHSVRHRNKSIWVHKLFQNNWRKS